ncbi:golgin subfamily A member 1-like [Uranotaenia lowii]|uniref:golgin subfamily A member 1-like n=1 Tax=Uranotaenia lowii TaxID=190385 RepID=UPI0024798162|nr:golgin subfamily A member 1-like [Uranotaenia lowii]
MQLFPRVVLNKCFINSLVFFFRLNTVNELRKQIDELMSTNLEQNAKLASLDSLHMEILDKNKIIKILNQRLLDMKKTLHEEIKNSNNNNSSLILANGNVHMNHTEQQFERSGSREKQIAPMANGLAVLQISSNDNISATTMGARISAANGTHKSATGTSSSASSSGIVMDEVNFRYLKHVIIKFLTSREVEARQLVKAVAALLQLSCEEEKLLQDTLTWKMSWFGSRPGQHSQISLSTIPPSS